MNRKLFCTIVFFIFFGKVIFIYAQDNVYLHVSTGYGEYSSEPIGCKIIKLGGYKLVLDHNKVIVDLLNELVNDGDDEGKEAGDLVFALFLEEYAAIVYDGTTKIFRVYSKGTMPEFTWGYTNKSVLMALALNIRQYRTLRFGVYKGDTILLTKNGFMHKSRTYDYNGLISLYYDSNN
ncbi:MAG: hypothetical protein HUU50_02680 [Candidatus Brocadiae bacterium]|nr:hypothetical protein [Candidatus Brocadiia bacterium]